MNDTASLKDGVHAIKIFLKNMPQISGVYQMIDSTGEILYVGKAKNLANRVTNYTRPDRLGYRIQSMISQVRKVEVITTKTEAEALLLEANLIKKHMPKYNILLKDDKSYPYILITKDHKFPRILKHRGAKNIKGDYYGPFASASAVNKSLSDMQKAFLIRPCSDSYFASRERPCIEYQIKRCSAPCVDKISEGGYCQLVKQAKEFLSGKNRKIQQELADKMEQASADMDYEAAAVYRDRIKALNHMQAKQSISIESISDADIIGLARTGSDCCIQVFFFRGGQNFGNKAYFFSKTEDISDSEIITSFLTQFYQSNQPPKEIYLSCEIEDLDIVCEALAQLADGSVAITIPKKGNKKSAIDAAVENAKASLEQKAIEKTRKTEILQKITLLFGLDGIPSRIEVYDNSHIMGKHEIGAMIVAGKDGFIKNAYRKFNIKGEALNKGDDYAMLREVLLRRFGRLKQEKNTWPDLVIIDGGAGQLSVAKKVFDELEILDKVKLVCIAKGPDRNAGNEDFYMPDRAMFTLQKDDPVKHYLQVLRDEAHRFAIGSHRIKRSNAVIKSELDSVPNIGAKRKKALLNHFGSAAEVKKATLEELYKVDGVNKVIAKGIYDFFNG